MRPNALILAYLCILDSISPILAAPIPSLEKVVDGQTPPTFLFATSARRTNPTARLKSLLST